ncbi:MAG TPA: hydroxysqualene dehydroxylase HpnE [Candidatus Cybelea sp.]|nr:hydroxysqualene dehydroxylase HpnE [Candidatus Cybelea sp.]
MPSQSVLVIGGGLAGLSSAVVLAEAGCRVHLFEKRPHLGGRATSYTLPDGSEVDNCQHVTLGCCTNLADFYRRVGAEHKICFYDRLYFVDSRGRRSTIAPSALPPPLHMAPSFLRFKSLSLGDKRSVVRGLLAIARSGGEPPETEGLSMLAWLERTGQTRAAIERFWRVVLVSALDEELSRADARYGIDVFWKAFLANREGYRMGIPRVPLGNLYEGCREAVVREGGEVRLRCGVKQIRVQARRFAGVLLEDGSEVSADACVVAVPHDSVGGLLSADTTRSGALLANLEHLETSPITGVHLWFDRPVMSEPFLALLDHTTQWIFNKSLLGRREEADGQGAGFPRESTEGNSQYLQLVISASYGLVPRSRQEIIDLCLGELAGVLPAARRAQLMKATVVKEVNATFSPGPGVDRWRPRAGESGIENLFLAGDWTRTGWPATMEGAVRSGYLAAESLLSHFGQPRNFLRPDLPLEGLCRKWAERRA